MPDSPRHFTDAIDQNWRSCAPRQEPTTAIEHEVLGCVERVTCPIERLRHIEADINALRERIRLALACDKGAFLP